MIEIAATSAHFDALKDLVGELNEALEAELRRANQRIGAKLNRVAKQIISEEIYSVPISLLASANRTFDMNRVPQQFREHVKAPAYRRKLTDKFLDQHFATSRQTKDGRSFRKWRRSSALLNNERYVISLKGRGAFEVLLVNTTEYALARDALGQANPPNKAGRRAGVQRAQPNVPDREKSKTRPVRWQQEAVKRNKDWIRDEYKDAIGRALGGRS